jgi:N-acetylglucosaminyldiphosphoundecaprenol N-acetyl-beta-D-mannosaminyltransferase
MSRIKLGPACLDVLDRPAIVPEIEKLINLRRPSQVITLNALMYNCARDDAALSAAINAAALVLPDSAGISWAAKFLQKCAVTRCPGIDLIRELCGAAVRSGYSLFLLGSAPGVAETAANKLKGDFTGLKVSGTHHGYFMKSELDSVIAAVKQARPDILLVGFSVPRQEKWIASNLGKLGVPVVMGVGGSFDVISGLLRRAPVWMQKSGLEWLFRTAQQPWRVFRIMSLPIFVINVLVSRLRSKPRGEFNR